MRTTRRKFLSLAGRAAGIGGLGGLIPFSPLTAAETEVTPDLVRLRPEIEPLVRLIERTPRERCVEMLAERLKAGAPFRELMAAAFLHALLHDGHHTVYLVYSALEMSRQLPPEERLLPLFWAVDVIKEHVARFKETPAPPLRGKLPPSERAAAEFEDAMKAWDRERAELAVIALARAEGAASAMRRLCHYGARDWSFIGHIPIAVSTAWRTLNVIGEQHAEPVLRYLVRELHERNTNQTQNQSYDFNLGLVRQGFDRLPKNWDTETADGKASEELLQVIRAGQWTQASQWVYKGMTEGGVSAASVWDAVHLAAGEFLIRFKLGNLRLANRALHSNTCGNALHHLFKDCADGRTRFFITLQAAAWVTAFTKNEEDRGMLRNLTITGIPDAPLPEQKGAAVEAIFSQLPPRPFRIEVEDRTGQDAAARLAFAFGKRHADHEPFLATARSLVATKATINSHDVKFPIAIFENRDWVSVQWRPHIMAASVHFLHGIRMETNEVVLQARKHLAG